VGQIALAVVLAQAAWRLVSSLTWYLIIPLLGKSLRGNTESVLFEKATTNPFPWESLFGSLLEFGLVLILVFYLNRWVQRKPTPATTIEDIDPEYSSTGEALTVEETGAEKTLPSDEKIVQRGTAEN
jgi:large-conductance mechanosensitive channel